MILNPKTILDMDVLTSPNLEIDLGQQLQPNGIDLRVNTILKLPCNKMSPFKMWADGKKVVPSPGACEGTLMNNNPAFILEKGYVYSAECFEMVKIPRGMAAMVYGRSTLHRNGVFCRASVYDSGFNDYVGLMMFPFVDFWVEQGTRIAQIIFHEARTSHVYNGQYGLKKGAKLNEMC